MADNLRKAGWSYGYVSAVDSQGRTIWIVDAHRDDGKRFLVQADEKLTSSNMMRQIAPSHRTIRVQHELQQANKFFHGFNRGKRAVKGGRMARPNGSASEIRSTPCPDALHRIALESFFDCRTANDAAIISSRFFRTL